MRCNLPRLPILLAPGKTGGRFVVPADTLLIAAPAEQHGPAIDAAGEVDKARLEAEVLVAAADAIELREQALQVFLEFSEADLTQLPLGITFAHLGMAETAELPAAREDVGDNASHERQGLVGEFRREDASNHGKSIVARELQQVESETE